MNDGTELLAKYVERVERCLDGIADANEDLRAVLAEAAGNGLNAKALKKLATIKRKGAASQTRGEIDDLVLYGRSLGLDLISS